MKYEQFLEETNFIVSKYESDRQELADKYTSDLVNITKKKDDAVAKIFEEYKKAQKESDKKALEEENKVLDKVKK